MTEWSNILYIVIRKVVFYTLVVLILSTLFLGLAELMTRALTSPQILPDPPPPTTLESSQANPYIVKMRPYLYFHIPGSTYIQTHPNYRVRYEINSQGFRGPEISQSPEGQKRLLIIGDSMVEGQGNEFNQTFSYLLGEDLRNSGWEIINGGVQGASPIYFAANMERYLALQPDTVLVVIYENDIFEDRVREVEYFELPFLENTDKLLGQSRTLGLLSISRFYAVVRREWLKRAQSPLDQIVDRNRATWPANQEQLGLFRSSPDKVTSSFVDQQWNMSRPYLDYVVTMFRDHNIQVLIANLNLNASQPGSPYQGHARHLDEQISTWAGESSVPFLSLLPTMIRVYEEKPISEIIIEGDGHPTAKGHAILAAELRPWLWQHLSEDH